MKHRVLYPILSFVRTFPLSVLVTIHRPGLFVRAKLGGPSMHKDDTISSRKMTALQDLGAAPVKFYPLGLCQGDCDYDYQCQTGLKCFKRSNGESVPGCTGAASVSPTTDFCYDPNGSAPSQLPSPFTMMPIPHFVTPSPVQTRAEPATASPASVSFTTAPVPATPAPLPVTPSPVPVAPIPTSTPPVPTPAMHGRTSAPTVDFATMGTFKLKMYWQYSFYWQCSHLETWWCMHCRNEACSLGDLIYVTNCSSTTQQFEFIPVTSNNKHVLIKLADQNLCFQKYLNHNFNLAVCNINSVDQHWFAGAGGFDEAKFQLNPVWNTTYCATQRHQPKADEQVHLEPVNVTIISNTNYWVRFYE